MKKIILTVVICILGSLICNAGDLIDDINNGPQPVVRPIINEQTGQLIEAIEIRNINDVPQNFREAAVKGKWNLFNLPADMAMQAYLDQKKGIGGGFWGVAIRSMFTGKHTNLDNYIPSNEAKRRIIANVKDSAYWAQKFANLGIFGGIMLLLLVGLIIFVIWKILKSKRITL